MTPYATAVRKTLRTFCRTVPIRGRHRLVDAVGNGLGQGRELLDIGGLKVEIDHAIRACRYMYYSIYEEPFVNWIRRTIRPGDAIMEPGANIGYITAHLLSQLRGSGIVIALEPSRTCITRLQHNNDLARLPNLHILNAAIADATSTATFWETPKIVSHGYGYLQAANWNDSTEGVAYEVPTHTVDELMKRFGLSRLAFLKLDVEGSELPALRGARESLAQGRIDHVLVETYIDLDNSHSEGIVHELIDLMESSGYQAHTMCRNGTLRRTNLRSPRRHKWRVDVMWAKT